jgi:hypothetical protein
MEGLADMLEDMLRITGKSDKKLVWLIAQARQEAADLPAHIKRVHEIRFQRKMTGDPEITMEEVCGEVLTEKTLTDLCEALTEHLNAMVRESKLEKA